MRHSAAHVMAAAVCRLYDGVKLDIGPATSDGFYYDFDLPDRLSPEDFSAIEAEMSKIVAEKLPFEQLEMTREEAEQWLSERDQTFKLERLAAIPEGEAITFYKCGDFMDLCRGPHVETTGDVRAFKLTSVAGSYFHGIETNPMLQRVYGIAAESPKAIRAILKQIEEAAKRDHRKLGKELDLFSSSEDVGPGLTHWHAKGSRIRSAIEDFWRREHYRGGYELHPAQTHPRRCGGYEPHPSEIPPRCDDDGSHQEVQWAWPCYSAPSKRRRPQRQWSQM